MILEKHPAPLITESGVRRAARTFRSWFAETFIPFRLMAPRNKEVDKSMVAWRGAQTGFFIALTTMVGLMTQKMMNGPDNTQIQKSVDRLASSVEEVQSEVKVMGHRMEMVESEVKSTGKRVDALQSAVDGALRGMRL